MKRALILIICCCFLTACGFHLRNPGFIPPKLRVLYLTSNNPYGEFEGKLKQSLKSVGIVLVNSPTATPITLQILATSLSYYPTSIGTSNQAMIYDVSYSMQFQLTDAVGTVLYGPQTVYSATNLTLNANQIITSNNQINILSDQLQRDVINKLFNVLSSPAVQQAIQPPIKEAHENKQ